ncbi:MAG: cation diffusion facilitator family transporter [Acidobacteriota bacterium]
MTARSPEQEKRSIALTSVVAAVGLTVMKAVVGVLTGSLGILAEAAHSGLDLVAALMTYFAVRIASRPPDMDHTYGHGKVESLSALTETLLLLLTCVWIVYEATRRLLVGDVEIDPNVWAFLTVVVSIVVNWGRAKALYRVARKHRSQALEADALHFTTDIWSSFVVLFGLFCVLAGQRFSIHFLEHADPVAALGVSVIVIYASYELGRRTVDSLLDRVSPDLSAGIGRAVSGVPGVLRLSRVRLREAGGRHFVDIQVDLDRSTAFERADEITTNIEKSVQALLPGADVVVHPEPVADGAESAVQKVQVCATRLGYKVHNVVVIESGGRQHVNYHLEVPDESLLREAWGMSQKLEAQVRQELPMVDIVNVHFDPRGVAVRFTHLSDATTQVMMQKARETLLSHPEIKDVHDLILHQAPLRSHGSAADGSAGAGDMATDLTCHCTMSGDTPVSRIHELDEILEKELRETIPTLRFLLVQPEPGPPGG